jgi:hypothetical protein
MNLFGTQRIVALVLLFVLFIAKRTKPRSSSAANLGFGLRLDGFYCSNTVLGECCARQVRTYSSQAYFFVLLAQASPITQSTSHPFKSSGIYLTII